MTPGKTTDYVVHVRGEVTERTDSTVTINGLVLPCRLGNGVHTLSTDPTAAATCSRDHCGDGDCDDRGWCDRDHCDNHGDRPDYGDQGDVIDAAQRAHDLVHEAPWAFCSDALCSAVRRAAVSPDRDEHGGVAGKRAHQPAELTRTRAIGHG